MSNSRLRSSNRLLYRQLGKAPPPQANISSSLPFLSTSTQNDKKTTPVVADRQQSLPTNHQQASDDSSQLSDSGKLQHTPDVHSARHNSPSNQDDVTQSDGNEDSSIPQSNPSAIPSLNQSVSKTKHMLLSKGKNDHKDLRMDVSDAGSATKNGDKDPTALSLRTTPANMCIAPSTFGTFPPPKRDQNIADIQRKLATIALPRGAIPYDLYCYNSFCLHCSNIPTSSCHLSSTHPHGPQQRLPEQSSFHNESSHASPVHTPPSSHSIGNLTHPVDANDCSSNTQPTDATFQADKTIKSPHLRNIRSEDVHTPPFDTYDAFTHYHPVYRVTPPITDQHQKQWNCSDSDVIGDHRASPLGITTTCGASPIPASQSQWNGIPVDTPICSSSTDSHPTFSSTPSAPIPNPLTISSSASTPFHPINTEYLDVNFALRPNIVLLDHYIYLLSIPNGDIAHCLDELWSFLCFPPDGVIPRAEEPEESIPLGSRGTTTLHMLGGTNISKGNVGLSPRPMSSLPHPSLSPAPLTKVVTHHLSTSDESTDPENTTTSTLHEASNLSPSISIALSSQSLTTQHRRDDSIGVMTTTTITTTPPVRPLSGSPRILPMVSISSPSSQSPALRTRNRTPLSGPTATPLSIISLNPNSSTCSPFSQSLPQPQVLPPSLSQLSPPALDDARVHPLDRHDSDGSDHQPNDRHATAPHRFLNLTQTSTELSITADISTIYLVRHFIQTKLQQSIPHQQMDSNHDHDKKADLGEIHTTSHYPSRNSTTLSYPTPYTSSSPIVASMSKPSSRALGSTTANYPCSTADGVLSNDTRTIPDNSSDDDLAGKDGKDPKLTHQVSLTNKGYESILQSIDAITASHHRSLNQYQLNSQTDRSNSLAGVTQSTKSFIDSITRVIQSDTDDTNQTPPQSSTPPHSPVISPKSSRHLKDNDTTSPTPTSWVAFSITEGTMSDFVVESGIISTISRLLSSNNVPILSISTNSSELILVQSFHVALVLQLYNKTFQCQFNPTAQFILNWASQIHPDRSIRQQKSSLSPSNDHPESPSPSMRKVRDIQTTTVPQSDLKQSSTQKLRLKLLPLTLFLIPFTWSEVYSTMMTSFTSWFHSMANIIGSKTSSVDRSIAHSNSQRDIFLSYTHIHDEVTVLSDIAALSHLAMSKTPSKLQGDIHRYPPKETILSTHVSPLDGQEESLHAQSSQYISPLVELSSSSNHNEDQQHQHQQHHGSMVPHHHTNGWDSILSSISNQIYDISTDDNQRNEPLLRCREILRQHVLRYYPYTSLCQYSSGAFTMLQQASKNASSPLHGPQQHQNHGAPSPGSWVTSPSDSISRRSSIVIQRDLLSQFLSPAVKQLLVRDEDKLVAQWLRDIALESSKKAPSSARHPRNASHRPSLGLPPGTSTKPTPDDYFQAFHNPKQSSSIHHVTHPFENTDTWLGRSWCLVAVTGFESNHLTLDTVGVVSTLAAPVSASGLCPFYLSTFCTDHIALPYPHVKEGLLALHNAFPFDL